MIFYYCDYADKRTLEPANVFATLTRQLLEKVDPIPEPLASAIEEANHDGERLTDQLKALEIFQRSIELCSDSIYVVLDGLDEATETSQKIICQGFRQLLNNDLLSIKLFLTGREELGTLLRIKPNIPFLRVPISPSAIAFDIDSYVRASTRRRIFEGSLVIQDLNLEELIVQELVKGAQGM